MDISKDVKTGMRFEPPKEDVDDVIRFYAFIRDLMIHDKSSIEKGVIISKSFDKAVAETPLVEGAWPMPFEFKDVVDFATEAPEYGAWAEVDLSDMNSPQFIFTASKSKSFYHARNLLRLPISGWGRAITFKDCNGAVFYSEGGTEISNCTFADLIDVANDKEWLSAHRITCALWNQNGRSILQFRHY